ncbi:MAG: DUF1697 domain-containing protein [Nannocystales bacterium]
MARFVALLRGINVGGNHTLPMADLRTHFEEAGATAVETYIQSGNVVFEAPARQGAKLAQKVAHAIELSTGFSVPIVVRTAEAWNALVEGNPFAAEAAKDPKRVHAMLLDRTTTKPVRAKFEPDCRLGERFEMLRDALYVDYPNGSARSKLDVTYSDRVLSCTTTARNWRTIVALQNLVNAS